MTSRKKISHLDLLAVLSDIKDNGVSALKYINVFDDQIDEAIFGETYSFAMPAAFIEFEYGAAMMLGRGYTSFPDCIVRIHIAHMLLNVNDSMERNIEVFDLVDLIKTKLLNSDIRFCSSFMATEDKLDYKHGSVYKYVLGFKSNFIDSKGSEEDPDSGAIFGYLVDPTLNINVFGMWESNGIYTSNIFVAGNLYVSQNGGNYVNQEGLFYGNASGNLHTNVVSYRGEIYICRVSNNDETFDPNKWLAVKSWTPEKEWEINSYTFFYSKLYQANVTHTDAIFNPFHWNLIL